ncbi:MAG: hypothetical protein AAFX10_10215 [Pseudomonadota bacterium]
MDLCILLSVTSLVLAIVIAVRQHEIAKQTLILTESIESNEKTRSRVDRFFGKYTTWQIHLPVSYQRRPLPLVAAGDFFAMHVLSALLGDERATVEFVNTNPQFVDRQAHQNSSLFLCSPKVNKGLGAIYPVFEESKYSADEFHANYKLPCWFQSDHPRSEDWMCIRALQNDNLAPVIAFAANQVYDASQELELGEGPGNLSDQNDHAILARVSQQNRDRGNEARLDIVMAGVHQFGTWIVAHYVDQLVRGITKAENPYLLDTDYEFVAVVDGVFAADQLHVIRSGLRPNYFWYRRLGEQAWCHLPDS